VRFIRIASLLAVAALAASAHASSAGPAAPTGLHGFLLRADEAASTTFHRTPSFAWKPVAGATRYQFQLSRTSTFRDNGIVYNNTVLTPVEAPPLTLPWITGSPHALYARARALFNSGATAWSAPFGFNVVPPAAPGPLPSYPGLLRWSPVEGADGYQVWLVDAGKMELVRTNVLDERDLYTFHQAPNWIGTVHWRIRAIRGDTLNGINGIPVSRFGPWSPIYASSNAAPSSGPIQLTGTLSDVFSDGSPTAPAQRLMPGFLWSGNESLGGTPAELYRVYVYTDSQCVNLVYTSAVVGSPAYAPRPFGALAMPQSAVALAAAGGLYLPDGLEPSGFSYDGATVTSTEQAPDATPTTQVPGELPSAGGTAPAPSSGSPPAGSGSSGSGSSTPAPSSGLNGIGVGGRLGAPVDLWDTNWPESGYYWTVVPVAAVSNGSSVVYRDLELPQDVCEAGRVQRFGVESEPSLTAGRSPYATGLSATGHLTSAAKTSAFYGQPLIAWTPALGAGIYQVQWSKTRYPFVVETDPRTSTKGFLTSSTSAVLPLTPGTWWYRVRGLDYNLPTGVQQMSWSTTQKLVVSKPRFKVVPTAPKRKFKIVP
jgi:hypothetical protein